MCIRDSALRAPVTRIAAVHGERNRSRGSQRFGSASHEQADFPVARVIPERDRLTLLRAQATHRADDHVLRTAERIGAPAHARILRQAEDIAAWFVCLLYT